MNKPKQLAAILMTALLAASLAACSGGGNNANNQPDSGNAANNEGTAPGNASGVTDPAPADNPVMQGTGTYNGAADSHTVEIETPDGPTAFQLGESIDPAVLEQLQEKDPVTFEYQEIAIEGDATTKQRVLTKIEKAETSQGGGAEEGAERAETTELSLEIEGNPEKKTAKLAHGEGYSLYVFDELFDFDAKTATLSMKHFPDYKVEIVQFPVDYNLDMLREEAEAALSKTGEVRELKGDEINSTMRDADLFLLASSDKETKEVIVKDIDGIGYQFNVTMPVGEASDGFGPHAFASLNTIATE
ncbi:hypothetical protein [Paenibacillus methanolicus]|uniref:Lipoprotein n=1 Tax=Paenibacillus methanolicus TaxID=582686 RepID=A0A5S5BUC9_9BACL|nr:hypothetical protein [Paenibacillus methanolicus]TYP70574.1 hypothetical protein BCM02_11179 [Paenibacillus methanolicus]